MTYHDYPSQYLVPPAGSRLLPLVAHILLLSILPILRKCKFERQTSSLHIFHGGYHMLRALLGVRISTRQVGFFALSLIPTYQIPYLLES